MPLSPKEQQELDALLNKDKASQKGPGFGETFGHLTAETAEAYNPLPLIPLAGAATEAASRTMFPEMQATEVKVEPKPTKWLPPVREEPKPPQPYKSFAERLLVDKPKEFGREFSGALQRQQEAGTPSLTLQSMVGLGEFEKKAPEWTKNVGMATAMLLPAAGVVGKASKGAWTGMKSEKAFERAAKATKKVEKYFEKYLGNRELIPLPGEGSARSPERIKKAMEMAPVQWGEAGKRELAMADALYEKLNTERTRLRNTVHQFRESAMVDHTPIFPSESLRKKIQEIRNDFSTTVQTGEKQVTRPSKLVGPKGEPIEVTTTEKVRQGGEPHYKEISQHIDTAERSLEPNMVTPHDLLLITDELDKAINWGDQVTGATISKNLKSRLMRLRGEVKEALRGTSDVADAWAKADDVYSRFMDEATDPLEALHPTKSNRWKTTEDLLKRKNVDLRQKIDKAMKIATETSGGIDKQEVFRNFLVGLDEVNTAVELEKVRGLSQASPPRGPLASTINRGSRIGRWIGWIPGVAVGYAGYESGAGVVNRMTGGMGAILIAGAGMRSGEKVMRYLTSVDRMMNRAIKAERLSEQARTLAREAMDLKTQFGPAAPSVFMGQLLALESVPAARELRDFIVEGMTPKKSNVQPVPEDLASRLREQNGPFQVQGFGGN